MILRENMKRTEQELEAVKMQLKKMDDKDANLGRFRYQTTAIESVLPHSSNKGKLTPAVKVIS